MWQIHLSWKSKMKLPYWISEKLSVSPNRMKIFEPNLVERCITAIWMEMITWQKSEPEVNLHVYQAIVLCFILSHFLQYQYFLTCSKSLQTFLKEKGKLSLKEMTKASNDYYQARGYPKYGNQDKRSNGNGNG